MHVNSEMVDLGCLSLSIPSLPQLLKPHSNALEAIDGDHLDDGMSPSVC